MKETMNNVVEATTEVSEEMEIQDSTIEESSGPSKGFVALVVGGIAAVAVGTAVAIKRHKKKKASAEVEDEEIEDEEIEDAFEEPEA